VVTIVKRVTESPGEIGRERGDGGECGWGGRRSVAGCGGHEVLVLEVELVDTTCERLT